MYHAIVRRNVKKLFEALGRGDIDYAVAGMAHSVRAHLSR